MNEQIKILSCLGCYAYDGDSVNGHCSIGFKTEQIKPVAGFYGRNKMLVGCNKKPSEKCPKPRTWSAFYKAWRVATNDPQL
jgi:hypothetical protein